MCDHHRHPVVIQGDSGRVSLKQAPVGTLKKGVWLVLSDKGVVSNKNDCYICLCNGLNSGSYD